METHRRTSIRFGNFRQKDGGSSSWNFRMIGHFSLYLSFPLCACIRKFNKCATPNPVFISGPYDLQRDSLAKVILCVSPSHFTQLRYIGRWRCILLGRIYRYMPGWHSLLTKKSEILYPVKWMRYCSYNSIIVFRDVQLRDPAISSRVRILVYGSSVKINDIASMRISEPLLWYLVTPNPFSAQSDRFIFLSCVTYRV